MFRPLPTDRALLMQLLSDVKAVDGALVCLTAAMQAALEQETEVRPLDDRLFEQTGSSSLPRRGVTSPAVCSAIAWATQGLSRLPLLWEWLEPGEGEALASECR